MFCLFQNTRLSGQRKKVIFYQVVSQLFPSIQMHSFHIGYSSVSLWQAKGIYQLLLTLRWLLTSTANKKNSQKQFVYREVPLLQSHFLCPTILTRTAFHMQKEWSRCHLAYLVYYLICQELKHETRHDNTLQNNKSISRFYRWSIVLNKLSVIIRRIEQFK